MILTALCWLFGDSHCWSKGSLLLETAPTYAGLPDLTCNATSSAPTTSLDSSLCYLFQSTLWQYKVTRCGHSNRISYVPRPTPIIAVYVQVQNQRRVRTTLPLHRPRLLRTMMFSHLHLPPERMNATQGSLIYVIKKGSVADKCG
jgi:hypothetical protein